MHCLNMIGVFSTRWDLSKAEGKTDIDLTYEDEDKPKEGDENWEH